MHKKFTLSNGLRVITVPMADTQTVTVLILVEAGSKYETKEINGVSHFLEHMTFKGTKKRPAPLHIAEPLDRIGGEYNAFTGQEYTGYYAKADAKNLNLVMDIISDITLNPKFDEKEMNKERGVIIEEINMYTDTPMRHISEVWEKLLYGDTPAGWNIAGRKEVITRLSRQDFVSYHDLHYIAPKMLMVVAGKINAGAILKKTKTLFRGMKTGRHHDKAAVMERQTRPVLEIEKKKTDQTHIALGVRAYNLFDERRSALAVLATILGGGMSSRLFQLLRGKMGAAYYVKTLVDQTTDTGHLATWAGIDNRRAPEIVKAILNEYRAIRREKVGRDELTKAKEHLRGSLVLGIETSDELASFYGFQEILKKEINEPAAIIRKIDRVTAEDIRAVAQDIFQNKKLNLAMIGPFKDTKQFHNLLKL